VSLGFSGGGMKFKSVT